MKIAGLLLVVVVFLAGCGAGHRKLTSITVSPAAAAAVASSRGTAQYTATGIEDNGSTVTLTQADDLSWKTSKPAIATIDDSGTATCVGTGVVTITATAPVDLTIQVSTNVQNTSPDVSGTASLNCM